MIRFGDGTEVFVKDGRSYSSRNGNRCKTAKQPKNDDVITGKKHELPTPNPQSVQGSKKQRFENAHGIDGKTNTGIVSQNKEPDDVVPIITNHNFSPSNENGQNADKPEGESLIISIDCSSTGGDEKEGMPINYLVASNDDVVGHESEELQGSGEITEKRNEDEWSNKGWNDFVDVADVSETPNLEAYLETKEIRRQMTARFADEIEACISELRKTTNEILSEVVAPICNQFSKVLEDTEDEIIKTMVSNHIRRNKLLELIHEADAVWKNKYTTLLADILGETKADGNVERDGKTMEGETDTSTTKAKGGKETVSGDPQDQEGRLTQQDPSYKKNSYKQTTVFGQDADWEELIEYEPSRLRILSFLDQREKGNFARGNFGEVMDEVHAGLESEIQAVLDIASNLFHQTKEACLESEEEIENIVMENYERRRNLREELEKSAREAQERFARLLSRLG